MGNSSQNTLKARMQPCSNSNQDPAIYLYKSSSWHPLISSALTEDDSLTYLHRSFYLKNHPVLNENRTYKENYCRALIYFARKYKANNDTAMQVLAYYYCSLLNDDQTVTDLTSPTEEEMKSIVGKVSALRWKRFRLFTYQLVFLVDCLFICAFDNEDMANSILSDLKSFFPRQRKKYDDLFSVLYGDCELKKGMDTVKDLVSYWKQERDFFRLPSKRIMVAATMSAGKSTLINAIVGKTLMRTAQEACTAHLCRLHNKPFEDDVTQLKTTQIMFDASPDMIADSEKAGDCHIGTFFHTFVDIHNQICIIDTPGVNSAINREHGVIAKKALHEEKFDLLVYVLNANQLGTDDEISYLKYITARVPKEKIIFVLNKLDTFRKRDDSIKDSIMGVKNDLIQLGFESPVILPVSAYFSLLIKKKRTGSLMEEDEEEELERLIKKYSKTEYVLSPYYDVSYENAEDDILTQMSIKCGLYGLETKLFGERENEENIPQV